MKRFTHKKNGNECSLQTQEYLYIIPWDFTNSYTRFTSQITNDRTDNFEEQRCNIAIYYYIS